MFMLVTFGNENNKLKASTCNNASRARKYDHDNPCTQQHVLLDGGEGNVGTTVEENEDGWIGVSNSF
jgi:hypothetical protein